MLRIENKTKKINKNKQINKKKKRKNEKQQKKKKTRFSCNRVRTANSNVTTTAPANYVFKTESSFYIITYNN